MFSRRRVSWAPPEAGCASSTPGGHLSSGDGRKRRNGADAGGICTLAVRHGENPFPDTAKQDPSGASLYTGESLGRSVACPVTQRAGAAGTPLSLYVMLWRGACPRVTARSGRGTARGVVPAPSCRTPLRPGSGCCRLCLTLSFRLRRNRGTLPRRQTPAVQNRPAKPYPNTNIALLYTRRAVLSTGSFERIPKRRKVCAIRRCAVPIPRAIRAFFRRLLTAADAAG